MAATPAFEVEGLNKLLRALEKLDDEANDSFKEVSYQVGVMVAQQAREEVPVRTGRLKDSIRPAKSARGAKIRAGKKQIPYAGVIHFGWKARNIWPPNQFLYRAVDKKVDQAVDMYLEQVYKIWNRNV